MFSIRLYLLLLLALAPLANKAQMLTVAQYEALPLDKIDTPPTHIANDSLTKELLAHRFAVDGCVTARDGKVGSLCSHLCYYSSFAQPRPRPRHRR